jgi:uncharacterized protein YjbI with pentapeptide repeats
MRAARLSASLVLVATVLAAGGPAIADCADFAQPGVYWRRCLQDGQNLRAVDLTEANLRDASFKRTDLTEALLVGVDARRAKFVSATMVEIDLSNARLVQADLTKADLTGASLVEADLTRAKLFRANLKRANLTGARLDGTDLLNADLAGATWIDGVTICAEDSIGQCHRRTGEQTVGSDEEPSG